MTLCKLARYEKQIEEDEDDLDVQFSKARQVDPYIVCDDKYRMARPIKSRKASVSNITSSHLI
jgi:hypothetical protein